MKKIVLSLTLLFVLVLFFFDPLWLPDRPLPYLLDRECPFCDYPENQVVTQNDLAKVILNYAPVIPGQMLIMPKRHVERFEQLTPEEFAALGEMVKRMQCALGDKDYVLVVQTGYYGGQTVNHTHIHMIPRGTESTLMKKIQLWQVFLTDHLIGRDHLTDEELIEQVKAYQKELHDRHCDPDAELKA